MNDPNQSKSAIRKLLRERLAAMTEADRHARSIAVCALLSQCDEFTTAKTIMLFLSMPTEVDTAPLALRAWQAGKTIVVPKLSWEQRRMLPTEITSLHTGLTVTAGVREPVGGKPVPVDLIDLVIVPGLGFSSTGHRIGRGMGFYDRFLAQDAFAGISCGMGFEEQVVSELPVLDHDVPLAMLVTDRGVRRFVPHCVHS